MWHSKKFIIVLIGIILLLSGLLVKMKKDHAHEITSISNYMVDSLKQENFILKTTLDRYELTLEMLKEEDSNAAHHFDTILHSKTE